jgi:hypothetical protein
VGIVEGKAGCFVISALGRGTVQKGNITMEKDIAFFLEGWAYGEYGGEVNDMS